MDNFHNFVPPTTPASRPSAWGRNTHNQELNTPEYNNGPRGHSGATGRRAPRTDKTKLEEILHYITYNLRWNLGKFLYLLFTDGGPADSPSRVAAVSKFLSGETDHQPIQIVQLMFNSQHGKPKSTHRECEQMFSVSTPASEIHYARPAIATWALELVTGQLEKEVKKLLRRETGLRVRATSSHVEARVELAVNTDGPGDGPQDEDAQSDLEDEQLPHSLASQRTPGEQLHVPAPDTGPPSKRQRRQLDPVVNWERISGFSLEAIQATLTAFSPTIWHILMKIMRPETTASEPDSQVEARYRPKHIVSSFKLKKLKLLTSSSRFALASLASYFSRAINMSISSPFVAE